MDTLRPHRTTRKSQPVHPHPQYLPYLLTHRRAEWRDDTESKRHRFLTEEQARAYLSALQRIRVKGGAVIARLEHRDPSGIWRTLPLDGGSQ